MSAGTSDRSLFSLSCCVSDLGERGGERAAISGGGVLRDGFSTSDIGSSPMAL